MQSWASLRQALAKQGFQSASFVAFTCREHGTFRACIPGHPSRYPCPACNQLLRTRYLAPGITRRSLPVIEQSNRLVAPRQMRPVRALRIKMSAFERQARRLKLTDEADYAHSAKLQAWARANRRSHYVPDALLAQWGMAVYECDVSIAIP
jgi:hypothetical protein